MGKLLFVGGVVLMALGLLVMMGVPLFRLPGDFLVRRGPVTSGLTAVLPWAVRARAATYCFAVPLPTALRSARVAVQTASGLPET